MNRRIVSAPLILKSSLFAACLASLLVAGSLRPGLSQSPRERKLEVRTFTRMPVRVKEVRNLQKEKDWFRDLEIEVQNISKHPIYFISIAIKFPDMKLPQEVVGDGSDDIRTTAGFTLSYGASRLSNVRQLAAPDDPPLNPGETYVFTMPMSRVQGLESMQRMYGLSPQAADKIHVEFSIISLGDGTGYVGGQRMLYSKKKV
ncbi:MAG TPA: hypothetical protein VEY09_15735 [Pyrinomonadaceae bacterium]|nr:hypothetical protein [Pyrinomonadaceae bacterium]